MNRAVSTQEKIGFVLISLVVFVSYKDIIIDTIVSIMTVGVFAIVLQIIGHPPRVNEEDFSDDEDRSEDDEFIGEEVLFRDGDESDDDDTYGDFYGEEPDREETRVVLEKERDDMDYSSPVESDSEESDREENRLALEREQNHIHYRPMPLLYKK